VLFVVLIRRELSVEVELLNVGAEGHIDGPLAFVFGAGEHGGGGGGYESEEDGGELHLGGDDDGESGW
jgi:hypothetical protein